MKIKVIPNFFVIPSDADWVGLLSHRKSTTGYYLLIGGDLIS